MKLNFINEDAKDSTNYRILLLVHPDCMSSDYGWVPKQAEEYLVKLERYLPKFDKLIIFRMHGPVGTKNIESSENKNVVEHFKRLNALLKRADLDLYDKDLGHSLFNNEISSFIIDNPNGTLYLAGGYQSGCLRQVANHLSYNIGWLIKEQGYKVRIFEPLVFRFDRTPDHPWWEKNWPGKVGEWGFDEDDKKPKYSIPKEFRHSVGTRAEMGEYKRDGWWEGPVKED